MISDRFGMRKIGVFPAPERPSRGRDGKLVCFKQIRSWPLKVTLQIFPFISFTETAGSKSRSKTRNKSYKNIINGFIWSAVSVVSESYGSQFVVLAIWQPVFLVGTQLLCFETNRTQYGQDLACGYDSANILSTRSKAGLQNPSPCFTCRIQEFALANVTRRSRFTNQGIFAKRYRTPIWHKYVAKCYPQLLDPTRFP